MIEPQWKWETFGEYWVTVPKLVVRDYSISRSHLFAHSISFLRAYAVDHIAPNLIEYSNLVLGHVDGLLRNIG